MGLITHQFEDNFITTSVDRVLNWARESSIWPMGFGLACCAIEMMAASASRFDIARFGAEDFGAEARDVEARRGGRHHLDRAARQTEAHGPERILAGPVQDLVHVGRDEVVFELVID